MTTGSEQKQGIFPEGDEKMNTNAAFVKGTNAPDGIHENIVFNEYKDPSYWLKRRTRRAFIENVGPILIVVGTLVAFLLLGYIEVGR